MNHEIPIFSKRLKQCREQKGYTISRFACYVNISKSLLSSYENGRCYPTVKNLQIICNFLNISSDYLLGVDLSVPKSRIQILPVINKDQSTISFRCCDCCFENCYYFKEQSLLYLINPSKKYICGQLILCQISKKLTPCIIHQLENHFYLCPTNKTNYKLYDINDKKIQIIGIVLEKIELLIEK